MIDLWPRLGVPVYATPFTAGMLKAKLAENGGRLKIPIHEIPLEGRFKAGPFDVEMVSVAHSIPESSALAIHTPLGTVIHTGDWKLDATPITGTPVDERAADGVRRRGRSGHRRDSTNSMREGTSPSERDVAKTIAEL